MRQPLAAIKCNNLEAFHRCDGHNVRQTGPLCFMIVHNYDTDRRKPTSRSSIGVNPSSANTSSSKQMQHTCLGNTYCRGLDGFTEICVRPALLVHARAHAPRTWSPSSHAAASGCTGGALRGGAEAAAAADSSSSAADCRCTPKALQSPPLSTAAAPPPPLPSSTRPGHWRKFCHSADALPPPLLKHR